ncbi:hypothetical protein F2Q69_00014377 [Brassica cretica]|uniref:Uncharacterized protein n=1 Tax=Brassica cretica TaxID=69181 RepID=A0A8S9R779_BRACR|nr:hypothetical protein F2Q69_00014377 [Brassica cretica]
MKVTTTPAAHLAFANLAYCSPSDLSQFAVRGSDLFLTNVADVHTEKFPIQYSHKTQGVGDRSRGRGYSETSQKTHISTPGGMEKLLVWTKSHIGVFSGPCTTTSSRSEEDTVIPKLLCGASGSANKTGKPLLVKEASNLQIIPESCDNFVMITNGDGDEP